MKSTTVERSQIKGVPCVRFVFNGELTYEEAVTASQVWRSIFTEYSNQQFILIFNAKAMDDYEPLARTVWQNTINELKSQIRSMWVITDSPIIATGAIIMSLFTSFKIKTVSSEEDIVIPGMV